MTIKNCLKISCLVILLTSCQKVFVPDIAQMDPVLVVEGYLTTQPVVQRVDLSYSSPFGQRPTYIKETGATVYVTDDMGNRFNYYERGPLGEYRTDSAEFIKGIVGHTYVLHIETKDGNVYESTPQKILACAEPYRLRCNRATEEVLTEDAYGAPLEVYYDGVDINVSSTGILPTGNFYQYTWNAYEEHLTTVESGITIYYFYQHRRLSGKYFSYISTASADGLSDLTIRNKKVLFLATNDLTSFDPILPDTLFDSTATIRTAFQGLLFKLQTRSLTPSAYEFWNGAEDQLNAKGELFDPVTSQINGNMICVSDSTKKVYGIFTASDQKNKFEYFYFNNSNRTFSEDIDSFPQLVLDTFLQDTVPKGWIFPPF